jgi:Tfp pilus assembly protein PilO
MANLPNRRSLGLFVVLLIAVIVLNFGWNRLYEEKLEATSSGAYNTFAELQQHSLSESASLSASTATSSKMVR